MHRPQALTGVLQCIREAVRERASNETASHLLAEHIFAALEQPAVLRTTDVCAAPVAYQHLNLALDNARRGPPSVSALADAFRALAPKLNWHRRAGSTSEHSGFDKGHANAYLVGPDGLEQRDDVVIGASLMAPEVTYPFHSHPPEEIYVVMSQGEWYNERDGWYTPGIGGLVHHRPGIVHTMRSGAEPLLALWCLSVIPQDFSV